jgi:adenine-specific DNA-methyltransferase
MPTLQWWTRDADVRAADSVPYRLLKPETDLGGGDPATQRASGNMLIQGTISTP